MKLTKTQYITGIYEDVEFEVDAELCDSDWQDSGVEVISATWDKSQYTKTQNLVIEAKLDLNDFDFVNSDFN